MNRTVRLILFITVLLALSVISLLIPIPGAATGPARADEKLVVITPHWDGIRNEFRPAFASWYRERTGRTIDIEWLDQGGTSDCVRYILSQFKRTPAGIGVDLFFGGGTDPYYKLKREGVLERVSVPAPVLQKIPRVHAGTELWDADSTWYGAVLSGFGIVYNKRVIELMNFRVPSGWNELADPRYAGWVGAADLRNSGTMHLMFEIILQAYGWEQGWRIITGITANTKTFTKGANEVPKMVAKGDVAFGLAIDFYGWAEVSEAGEDKVGFLLPAELTIIGADALGMLRGAPNPEAARLFVEFVLSEDGQKLWFLRKGEAGGPVKQELNRMAVIPELYRSHGDRTNVRQDPFTGPAGGFQFDNTLSSRRWSVVNDLAGVGLIDRHDALRRWWRRSMRPADVGYLERLAVPVGRDECLRAADSLWNDPVKRNETLLEWQKRFARAYE